MTQAAAATYTPLDRALAHLRARRARRLIPETHSDGRILDLGCGRIPVFLSRAGHGLRVGTDHAAPDERPDGIRFVSHDIETPLPFREGSFDVVTMLAVLEHLVEEKVDRVIAEVHRVLAPGGVLVLTTPPPRTDRLLHVLERLRTVSTHMMEDHENTFGRRHLRELFDRSPFTGLDRVGYFELGMNIWAIATKHLGTDATVPVSAARYIEG